MTPSARAHRAANLNEARYNRAAALTSARAGNFYHAVLRAEAQRRYRMQASAKGSAQSQRFAMRIIALTEKAMLDKARALLSPDSLPLFACTNWQLPPVRLARLEARAQ